MLFVNLFPAYNDLSTQKLEKNWGTGQECLVSERILKLAREVIAHKPQAARLFF